MPASGEIVAILDDGDRKVDRDSDPGLTFDSVFGTPIEIYDSQEPFDLAKKQVLVCERDCGD